MLRRQPQSHCRQLQIHCRHRQLQIHCRHRQLQILRRHRHFTCHSRRRRRFQELRSNQIATFTGGLTTGDMLPVLLTVAKPGKAGLRIVTTLAGGPKVVEHVAAGLQIATAWETKTLCCNPSRGSRMRRRSTPSERASLQWSIARPSLFRVMKKPPAVGGTQYRIAFLLPPSNSNGSTRTPRGTKASK